MTRTLGFMLAFPLGVASAVACSGELDDADGSGDDAARVSRTTSQLRPKAGASSSRLIKGQVLLLVDTSGSMVWELDASGTSTHGDSPRTPGTAMFCDNDIGTAFQCSDNVACALGSGGVDFFKVDNAGEPSRLLAAKGIVQDAILAHSELLDFGLLRFSAETLCTTQADGTTAGRCVDSANATEYGEPNGDSMNLTFQGSCGSSAKGGDVLVAPGAQSNATALGWVDYVEDFCSATGVPGGPARNPELRAQGPKPLARAIHSARTEWYAPIFGGASDALIDCRPYALVVLSDGGDSCGDSPDGDPSESVLALTAHTTTNPVKTYVLGMGDPSALDLAELDQMAAAGLTGTAKLLGNPADLAGAFAEIATEAMKLEACNNTDDTCDPFIDEGLGVYQECESSDDCSGSCNSGRCTCTNDADCDEAGGYVCDRSAPVRFCRPACTLVNGACENHGVKKCGAEPGECCVDNGAWTCDEIVTPPVVKQEMCNGLDDDCNGLTDDGIVCTCVGCGDMIEWCNGTDDNMNGLVDDNPIDIGATCWKSVGACTQGEVACINGRLECAGGWGPFTEVCNALDDDCDAIIDGQTRVCYTPGLEDPTRNVGICHDGAQRCAATADMPDANTPGVECPSAECWGGCVGERGSEPEICNGLDDDCDGSSDEGLISRDGHPTGDTCCAHQNQGADLCGIGVCGLGTWQCDAANHQVVCTGGAGPASESCNGLDDDCNGVADDVPGAGLPCSSPDGCLGKLGCDGVSDGVVCLPSTVSDPELCNGQDDNCNGAIDEEPDVLEDPALGGACDIPEIGHTAPPCRSGTKVCRNGGIACDGSIRASDESCNDKDDDCDGVSDEDGVCDGSGGSSGDGGGAGTSGSGGSEAIFGLATGGGGCACRSAGSGEDRPSGLLLGALLLGAAKVRRRSAYPG